MNQWTKIIATLLVVPVLLFLFAMLFAFPVKWLWNWLMPTIFGLPVISVWKAWGLMMLAGLLFKNGSSNKANK